MSATDEAARESPRRSAAGAALWIIAAGVIVAGLAVFRDTLIPFALALLLWLSIDGMTRFLGEKAPFLPRPAALALSLLFMTGLVAMAASMLAVHLQEMAQRADDYARRMNEIVALVYQRAGLAAPAPTVDAMFASANPGQWVRQIGLAVQHAASNFLFILIYVGFLFSAMREMPAKLDAIFPSPEARRRIAGIVAATRESVDRYLWVQTALSIIISSLTYCCLLLIGLDNAVFWAFLIFFLNYIPTIGSIIAVLMPTAFALLQFPGFSEPLLVALSVGVWQFVIGNFLQPRLTGDSLNLSAVVVLLSLALWGTIWGVAGAFLAAPLTVILMICAAQWPQTRWISVILSSNARPVIVAGAKV